MNIAPYVVGGQHTLTHLINDRVCRIQKQKWQPSIADAFLGGGEGERAVDRLCNGLSGFVDQELETLVEFVKKFPAEGGLHLHRSFWSLTAYVGIERH